MSAPVLQSPPSVSRSLAQFAVGPLAGRPAGRLREVVLQTITNSVVLGAAAADHEAVRIVMDLAQSFDTPPEASVLGHELRVGSLWAPLVNGMAMHVEDFDDTHLATVIHPGAPVVAAALCAAELNGRSGADLFDAVLVGVETALRVGIGVCPSHFDLGWHITGTAGHLGAAMAAARLFGLSADQALVALGLASVEAAGLTEANGSMTKCFHPGKAAADGVEAAMLAAAGISGPADPIEGRRGFAALMADEVDYEVMLEGLGSIWHTEQNTFKPYACGIVSHAVIDAGIQLRERIPDAARIARVDITVPPVVLDVMGVEDPENGLRSKFSVYHCFAVGLLRGLAGPEQFSDREARADDLVRLRRKIRVSTSETVGKDEAFVTVARVDGGPIEEHVEHATGSLHRPMTDDQLRDKCRLLAAPVLGDAVDELYALTMSVDQLATVAPLFAAARRADGSVHTSESGLQR